MKTNPKYTENTPKSNRKYSLSENKENLNQNITTQN